MKHPAEHDFLIVAPWWKWGTPVDPRNGRQTAPVFQKYDTPQLVNKFIENPQHSLKFKTADLVHVVVDNPTPAAPPIDPTPDGETPKKTRFSSKIYVPDEPNVRKIFLDTHKRFYLVVCQIACDAPGLPRVSRDKICEVGFVVRRRVTRVPTAATKEARAVLTGLRSARLQKAKLEAAWQSLRGGPARSDRALRLAAAKRASIQERRESVKQRVAAEQERLKALAAKLGLELHLQGWFPSESGADRIGFWDDVEETPADLDDEMSFPMYPLIPPPSQTTHAGQFGTIYFGLLPTGSRDTTAGGEPRFEDDKLYEIRCFARRHLEPHGAGEACPCPDALFWSTPTEPYRLASHFDLVGTSQQSFTVQLPSLEELEAQAGPVLGTRFVKPNKTPMASGNGDGEVIQVGLGIPEICFIPIPLITIVAMFVFELFLPVIMLLFGLFWMLKLKFCILPQINIDISAGISVEMGLTAAFGAGSEMVTELQDQYAPETLVALSADEKLSGDVALGETPPTSATESLSLTANIEFETEVQFA